VKEEKRSNNIVYYFSEFKIKILSISLEKAQFFLE
jgi:hypothetical protein